MDNVNLPDKIRALISSEGVQKQSTANQIWSFDVYKLPSADNTVSWSNVNQALQSIRQKSDEIVKTVSTVRFYANRNLKKREFYAKSLSNTKSDLMKYNTWIKRVDTELPEVAQTGSPADSVIAQIKYLTISTLLTMIQIRTHKADRNC